MFRAICRFVALASAIVLAGTAAAQPPGDDFYGWFEEDRLLWCQEKNDLKHLVEIRLRNPAEAAATLEQYAKQKLYAHARCGYSNIGPVQVGENEKYGVVPDGKDFLQLWFIYVGNSDFAFWILYTEPVVGEDL